ncbi:shewanella-like protein phosphatase 1 isoform X2 [Abrus precatorius]|uniref:Shewanella-like protein phosphatase 1 isoform X2 n=1 Tax=Abrus precatorius TaxID=3816 RepID=A0A8B8MP59_ABRPR|nr:shewanella-like protein phosphatase 1 isoform X2 [Abrus precatorius]
MASLCINSSPFPPPSHPRKLTETSLSSSLLLHNNNNHSLGSSLKPIVVSGDPPSFVSAPGRRILAVGDLHGDLKQARYALEMAGVLSSDGQDLWIGGESVLVQLGDILDRGEDEIAILSLLRSLDQQAKAKGGAVFQRQKGLIARSILFRPGGPLARELARHAVVLKVNDWIFCHGGLLPHHVAYGIERMNKEVSNYMRGLHENDNTVKLPFIATRGYDSVVWNRLYSRDSQDLVDYPDKQVFSMLEETLQAVGAKAMVVGHTPQTIGVNCKYNCSIWRIDVGMSSGVLNSRPEVLEIIDNNARVIRSKRDRHNELQAAAYT